MNETLSRLEKNNKNVIICGDMNIDLFKYHKEDVKAYLDTFLSKGYSPKITLPTRVSTTATLIDHIFTRLNPDLY